jgi:hypothetical protein
MNNETRTVKQEFGVSWIKSESGNTYLCPVGALRDLESMTDEHLRKVCMEESANPQND